MAKRFGDEVTEVDLIRDVYRDCTYPMPAVREVIRLFLEHARNYNASGYTIRFYKLGRIVAADPQLLTREGELRDNRKKRSN